MPRTIQDEFTDLPISRARKYQLRHQKAKVCRSCPEPAAQGSQYCEKHREEHRARCRKNARDLI